MPTRSTKLASLAPVAAANVTAFTVPAGMTYLVKEVVITNGGGGADTVSVRALDPLGVFGYLFSAAPVAAGARLIWDGWLALNPGDVLQVASTVGGSHFWISGTKLPGIA